MSLPWSDDVCKSARLVIAERSIRSQLVFSFSPSGAEQRFRTSSWPRLGVITTTQDKDGEVIERHALPALEEKTIRAAFEKFRGDFYQTPPMVSAIKQAGVPLYKLARQGKTVEREPRLVHVYRYSIDRMALPEIDFTVVCSKGFYVRTYAHDIGAELGCGAHLHSLRRTKSGRFDVVSAISVDEIKKSDPADIIARVLSLPQVSRMR
jgi:tRNA pseudouridine55 synthase